jgi:hypothetical protein
MTMQEKLGWGAAHLLPDNATAAWGARLIITQTGDVDIVHDRQHAVGNDDDIDDLLNWLNNVPWRQSLSDMLKSHQVSTREGAEVTVYQDPYIVVRGNSNGSHGYFYICAYPAEVR